MHRSASSMILYLSLLFVTALLVAPARAALPDDTLTLERCLEIALSANPDLAAEEASLRGAEAVVDQKRAPLRPSLSLSSTHKQSEGSDNTSAELAVSQLVSDGGRSELALRSALLDRDETRDGVVRRRQQLVYDVKAAYYDVLKALWNLDAAEETRELNEKQLRQAQAAYEAGVAPKSDVTAARVDLGQARLDATKAASALALSRSALGKTLGTELPPLFSVVEPEIAPPPSREEDEALERALSLRPDLRAKAKALRAAELNVTYAARERSAQLSTSGGYGWSDGDDGQWQMSLRLSVPLADGGLVSARTAEARAALDRARAQEASLRQTVIHEVRQALLSLREAEENLATTELNLDQAQENLDLAQGRYGVGVGSSLEVSQAAEAFTRARKNRNDALFDYHLALADLERATGSSVTAEEAR